MKIFLSQNWIMLSLALCLLLIPLAVNAFSVEFVQQYNFSHWDEAGFFSGIWHGLLAPYSLIARWFSSNIEMYAISNTGWFYDLGFLLGVGGSLPIGWVAAIIALIAMFI